MSDTERNTPPAEIVDGEVVGEFTGETLMNLPNVDDGNDGLAPPTPKKTREDEVEPGRRLFLTRLLVGGAGALALGGSAALLVNNLTGDEQRVVILPNGSEVTAAGDTDVALLVERLSQLEYELASLTAERDQYISDLDAARTEVGQMRAQLEDTNIVVGLWEELDRIDIDTIISGALGVVGTALLGVTSVAISLNNGLSRGRAVVADFIERFPALSNAMDWLGNRVAALQNGLVNLSENMEAAVEPVSSVTSMVSDFILWIIERLPFGAGATAQAGMDAIDALISLVPDTLTGISDDVLDPLARWYGNDERTNLFGLLLNPISNGVFDPAGNILENIRALETDYDEQLGTPITEALEQRGLIRQQIAVARGKLDQYYA